MASVVIGLKVNSLQTRLLLITKPLGIVTQEPL
jgi:hypothetical protein